MKRYSHETVVGFFVFAGIIGICYMAVNLGNLPLFGDNSYEISARFNTVTGLRAGSPVFMLGIEIGHVQGLVMDQENQVAMVRMKIAKGYKIFDDAIASIKTSGLIGDKYVAIDPGGSGDLLPPGGVVLDTESPVDLEALISKYAFGDVKK